MYIQLEIILKRLYTVNGDPVSIDTELEVSPKNKRVDNEEVENDEQKLKRFAHSVTLNPMTKCVKINDQETNEQPTELKVSK